MDKGALKKRFSELGASFRIVPEDAEVLLSLRDGSRAPEARELFYGALNGLERHFSVFIKGMPFCFMPDARDHILYRALPGRSYKRVGQCRGCSLKALCPGVEAGSVFSGKLRGELRPVLPVPGELVFELTKRCNLACAVCATSRTEEELPAKKLEATLKEAAALGIKNARFTGGEPFLSPNLLPLLKSARKKGFYTLVNTNATAGSDLAAAAPFIDNVLVSLQGHDAASDAAATGRKGLFGLKLSNMRALRRSVPVFRLGTVASAVLIKNFKAFYALASELGADVWEIYRPMRGGAGPRSGAVSPAHIKRLSSMINGLPGSGPRVLIANPVPLCLVPSHERKNLLGAGFDDGHTRLVADPRGFFKPSYYIEENLGTGITEALEAAYMKELRAFGWLAPGCRKCRWLLKCLGGSRLLAKAAAGSYFGNDPWLPDAAAKRNRAPR